METHPAIANPGSAAIGLQCSPGAASSIVRAVQRNDIACSCLDVRFVDVLLFKACVTFLTWKLSVARIIWISSFASSAECNEIMRALRKLSEWVPPGKADKRLSHTHDE
eukprot:986028-Amphidinium_carterae.1